MTQVDIYTNTDVENGKLGAAANLTGNKTVVAVTSFEVGEDDEAGSVYRLFPDLNPCLIPVDIKLMNDAIGSGEMDLGLYIGDKGEVIDADYFYDGFSTATAHDKAGAIDGMTAVPIEYIGKQLFELAGHTIADRKDTYDIALTVNTAPGAEGTITAIATFVQG